MAKNDIHDGVGKSRLPGHVGSPYRMVSHDMELGIVERALIIEDILRHAYLAAVMQPAAVLDRLDDIRGESELPGYGKRIPGHPLGMTLGIGVLELEGPDQ